jgi:hypothetical protein
MLTLDRYREIAALLDPERQRLEERWPEMWLRALAQGDPMAALPGPVGPGRLQYPLFQEWSVMIGAVAPTATTVTANAWTTTIGRVFPFYLDANINIAKIYLSTPATGTGANWQVGIFDGGGNQIYASGAITPTANITTVTPGTAFKLAAGQTYYFMVTNNNSSNATATMLVTPALSAATLPRWGTLAVTAGAIPASITPGSITATVGGFPVYTVLSAL